MKMFYERLITKSNTNQNNSNAQGTTIDPFANNVNNLKMKEGEILEYHYNNDGKIEGIKRIPSKEMVSNPWDQNMMQTNVQYVIVEPPKAQ